LNFNHSGLLLRTQRSDFIDQVATIRAGKTKRFAPTFKTAQMPIQELRLPPTDCNGFEDAIAILQTTITGIESSVRLTVYETHLSGEQ